jgi:phage terminase small subunit
MQKKLTLKQNKFVKEYIKTGNGAQSAIKAGYSEKTAKNIASENLTKPYIKQKIERTMSELATQIGMTAEKVLLKLNEVLDKDDDKVLSQRMKAIELAGKHHRLWNENEHKIDIVKEHQDKQKQLEELE